MLFGAPAEHFKKYSRFFIVIFATDFVVRVLVFYSHSVNILSTCFPASWQNIYKFSSRSEKIVSRSSVPLRIPHSSQIFTR